jgi:hypothetical protein
MCAINGQDIDDPTDLRNQRPALRVEGAWNLHAVLCWILGRKFTGRIGQ